jgi:hypothetical protein
MKMIDNPGTVARLLEQMEDQLPIPALPTKDVVRILRRRGVKASADRALSVKRVFYAGDEAGIVCDVDAKPSCQRGSYRLTDDLRIAPHHPLFPAILAYQRERVRRLAAADV